MSTRYFGVTTFKQISSKIEVDVNKGYREIKTYTGLREELEKELNTLDLNKNTNNFVRGSIDVNPDNIPTMTAEFGLELPTTWLYKSNDLQVPIWYNPLFKAVFEATANPYYNLNVIVNGLKTGREKGWSITQIRSNDALFKAVYDSLTPEQTDTIGFWYLDYERGVEVFQKSQPVLTKNVLVNIYRSDGSGLSTSLNLQIANTNKLFTLTGLRNNFGPIDSSINAELPTTGYYFYLFPEIEKQANGFFQVTQEWWWALDYSTYQYGAAITS